MAPVTAKISTMEPMTLPRRFMEDMLATALQMVVNTRGTTTMNMALRKMSPRGLKIRASLPMWAPRMQPRAMELMRMRGNR